MAIEKDRKINRAYDEVYPYKYAKWGTEYTVEAQIVISDRATQSDYFTRYNINYDQLKVINEKKVAPHSCFPFSIDRPHENTKFSTKKFEKETSRILGIKVRCKSSERCHYLHKNGGESKACYCDNYSSIVVQ